MKVILIDDDELVTLSLKTILESDKNVEVVAIGHDGQMAVELYEKHLPDVLLMDIRMPKMNGVEAGELIIKKFSDAKILYLTTFLDDEYIVKALKLGAKGYILKQNYKSILPTLNLVYLGQNVYGDEIMSKVPVALSTESSRFEELDLSDREKQIISEVAEGLSNKEISEKLFLSEGTVRNYISTILEKLELRDRTQLAIFYYKNCK